MDAVPDIPAASVFLNDGATGADGLAGDFILCDDIVAVSAVIQMPQKFHILIEIVDGVQCWIGQVFSGNRVAPDTERKTGIFGLLRAQAQPGGFKRNKIHKDLLKSCVLDKS